MKAFALFAALTLFNTCTSAGAVGGTVDIRKLAGGGYGASEREGVVTAFDQETFRRVWDEVVRHDAPPAVDFASEAVVFILAGERRTGGYSVEVRGAALDGETLVIDGEVKSPPKDAIVTQAITYPYAVIAVKSRAFKDVRWTP